jgi:hypothetical protein
MASERPLGSSYVLQDVIGGRAMGQVWRGRDQGGHQLQETKSWCSKYFATLTGPTPLDACTMRQLNALS